MSLFDWLLMGHLVGDFTLQTGNMAGNKATHGSWMLRHLAVYMLGMTVVLAAYAWAHPVPGWAVGAIWLFLAGTHAVLDRRAFTRWWMDRVVKAPDHPWLPVVVDQVFHLLTLAVVAQVLLLARP